MIWEGRSRTKFIIHGGDFIKGANPPSFGTAAFQMCTEAHRWMGETILARNIKTIEVLTEASVKSLSGTLGWGAIGALTLGSLGGLAGLIGGGRGTDVTFACEFKDGRKLVATVDSKTYAKIRGAMV